MNPILVAPVEEVLEQLVLQIWVYRARAGDHAGARARAERTLERLLARGLPAARGTNGALLLDPYATSNSLKSRSGEPADEIWPEWLETARRNATSLPAAPHRYRLRMRREWHAVSSHPGRLVVLRLPLPLRGAQVGAADLQVIEPAGALTERSDTSGRVELRFDAARVRGPIVVEMAVEFVAGEVREVEGPQAGNPAAAMEEELWLRPSEGLIAPSKAISAFAADLPGGPESPSELAVAAFNRLMSVLRLGDVHREHLDLNDRVGGLLTTEWVDCALAAAVMAAVCRVRGVPARVVSGLLLHPVAPALHSWLEVRLSPGQWVPFDFATWDYCAGNPSDPVWGGFFRGRVDARIVTEVSPREFTGWGSARPPERWVRQQHLEEGKIVHTLRALPSRAVVQRDRLALDVLGPA